MCLNPLQEDGVMCRHDGIITCPLFRYSVWIAYTTCMDAVCCKTSYVQLPQSSMFLASHVDVGALGKLMKRDRKRFAVQNELGRCS